MITTLFFDLDDTVWDPRPALIAADRAQWQSIKEQHPDIAANINRELISTIRETVIHKTPSLIENVSDLRLSVMRELLRHQGLSDKQADQSANTAFACFMAKRNDVELFDDAHDVLSTLSKRYQLAAITNGNADVHKTSLGRYFSFALRADQVGVAKPDAAIFNMAITQAETTADHCVHIGDSIENDVEGAINAGIRAIWFDPDGRDYGGATTVTALSELTGALERLA